MANSVDPDQNAPIIRCLKEPSHCGGSFEYPQHMFWLRNKTVNYLVHNHNKSPDIVVSKMHSNEAILFFL